MSLLARCVQSNSNIGQQHLENVTILMFTFLFITSVYSNLRIRSHRPLYGDVIHCLHPETSYVVTLSLYSPLLFRFVLGHLSSIVQHCDDLHFNAREFFAKDESMLTSTVLLTRPDTYIRLGKGNKVTTVFPLVELSLDIFSQCPGNDTIICAVTDGDASMWKKFQIHLPAGKFDTQSQFCDWHKGQNLKKDGEHFYPSPKMSEVDAAIQITMRCTCLAPYWTTIVCSTWSFQHYLVPCCMSYDATKAHWLHICSGHSLRIRLQIADCLPTKMYFISCITFKVAQAVDMACLHF